MSVGADVYGRLGERQTAVGRLGVQDKEVSVRSVIAVGMWLAGVGLVVVNMFVKPPIGELGLTLVAGAVVMNVRGYFRQFHESMRNGFELGRDYERGRVRQLR